MTKPPNSTNKDGSKPGENGLKAVFRLVFRHQLQLEHETTLFIMVSALDVVMTAYLLSRSDVQFVEANPVARFFIYEYGLKGMVAFKFLLVAFVSVICQIVAHTRPILALRVLQFAILVVSCVVIYSLKLLLSAVAG